MFDTLGRVRLMAVLPKEVSAHIEGRALVCVHKCVVAENAFDIARRDLKRIRLTIGMLILRSCKSRIKQSCVSQTMHTASHFNRCLMDKLDLLPSDPLGFYHLFANSMMVLR